MAVGKGRHWTMLGRAPPRLRGHLQSARRFCAGLPGEPAPRGKEITVASSSLRVDAVAAAGLDLSRRKIWEASIDGSLMLNGDTVKKKSTDVKEGDVVEVDMVLKLREEEEEEGGASSSSSCEGGEVVRRGRVEVREIGARTRKGGYILTLMRYKHFAAFRRTFSTFYHKTIH